MATSKRWIITTSGDHSLPDIAQQLGTAGFQVEQVLAAIGCITGVGPDSAAERARAIPGVADVSPDQPVSVGPPDAPISW